MVIGHLHNHANGFPGKDTECDTPENDNQDEIKEIERQGPPDIDKCRNHPEDDDRPCGAGNEGNEERRKELLLGRLDDPARETGRHRAAEAEHERDDRLPMESHLMHAPIQHHGEAGEEAGVLD